MRCNRTKFAMDMYVERRLTQYIAAVESNDLDALEDFYDMDFINIRHDRAGYGRTHDIHSY
jgi:hypothetical protein